MTINQEKPHLSIVATAYNEEAVIRTFIDSLYKAIADIHESYEILIVDDGSSDQTELLVRQAMSDYQNLRLIKLSRNFGHEAAITAGLEKTKGDLIVIMDADMQDPPPVIIELFKTIKQGYDVVVARRKSRKGETWLKRKTSRMFYSVAKKMTGLDIPEDAGDFRIMKRQVVDAILSLKENNRFLKMIYAYVGYKTGEVFFDRDPRYAGQSKYNYLKLINAALDAILGFSTKPLRLLSILSISLGIISFIFSGFIVIQKLFIGLGFSGWASVMFFISSMFAILFIFLGIIAEYIGRIMIESKQRPVYYISEEISSNDKS